MLFSPIHSPTSDGGAAAVLCSEEFVRKHHLEGQAVEIVALEMRTDFPSTFKSNSRMNLVSIKVKLLTLFR